MGWRQSTVMWSYTSPVSHNGVDSVFWRRSCFPPLRLPSDINGKVKFLSQFCIFCLFINVQIAVHGRCSRALLDTWQAMSVCFRMHGTLNGGYILGHFFLYVCWDAFSTLLKVFIRWVIDGVKWKADLLQTYSMSPTDQHVAALRMQCSMSKR